VLPSGHLVPSHHPHLSILDFLSHLPRRDVQLGYLKVSLCIIVSVGDEENLSSEGSLDYISSLTLVLDSSGTV